MEWYLVVFSLHMLAAENVHDGMQVMKFNTVQDCEKARVAMVGDGVASACTSHQNDVSGFIAAMNCQNPHTDQIPGGLSVVRVSCAPYISVPK